jgi:hypothetical protein
MGQRARRKQAAHSGLAVSAPSWLGRDVIGDETLLGHQFLDVALGSAGSPLLVHRKPDDFGQSPTAGEG